ncbi:MFS transporter, partial [Alcaligenes pakistanensis]
MVAALTFFFIGFNVLEALQPSLVSRVAPPEYKGLALGFYNTSQSLGVFAGGLIGGILAGQGLTQWVLWTGAGLALLWLLTARGFKDKY